MRYEILESYSDHDHLINMPVSPQAKKLTTCLGDSWQARFILIQKPKGEIKGFITSYLCPKTYSGKALVDVYWQRWAKSLHNTLKTKNAERKRKATNIAREKEMKIISKGGASKTTKTSCKI